MKKISQLIILGILVGGIYFSQNLWLPKIKFLLASPCATPINYQIGLLDKNYQLSEKEFLKQIDQASQIWEQPTGYNLFDRQPQAVLVINLIYSDRQSALDQLNQMEKNLHSGQSNLEQLISQYRQLSADFQTKLASFNQQVNSWNQKGGAPLAIYQQLYAQQTVLKAEAEKLNNLAKQLNLQVQDYNFQVGQFNQNIQQYNQLVVEKPEAGLYDSAVPKIDIYLTTSNQELIHTLAHEMGHALGLEHLNNPQAIMYPYSSEILKPTNEEIANLQLICSQKNWQIYWQEILARISRLSNSST